MKIKRGALELVQFWPFSIGFSFALFKKLFLQFQKQTSVGACRDVNAGKLSHCG